MLLNLGHYWEVSYACVFIVLCACLRRLIHYRILFTEMYRAAVLTLETSHQIEHSHHTIIRNRIPQLRNH